MLSVTCEYNSNVARGDAWPSRFASSSIETPFVDARRRGLGGLLRGVRLGAGGTLPPLEDDGAEFTTALRTPVGAVEFVDSEAPPQLRRPDLYEDLF